MNESIINSFQVNNLMELMKTKDHKVFITTHSPYVLTSLNNLLYAYQVGKKKEAAVQQLIPKHNWVSFEDIGAWFVKNGTVTSILDKKNKPMMHTSSFMIPEMYDVFLKY
jgi:hypothetical protein